MLLGQRRALEPCMAAEPLPSPLSPSTALEAAVPMDPAPQLRHCQSNYDSKSKVRISPSLHFYAGQVSKALQFARGMVKSSSTHLGVPPAKPSAESLWSLPSAVSHCSVSCGHSWGSAGPGSHTAGVTARHFGALLCPFGVGVQGSFLW